MGIVSEFADFLRSFIEKDAKLSDNALSKTKEFTQHYDQLILQLNSAENKKALFQDLLDLHAAFPTKQNNYSKFLLVYLQNRSNANVSLESIEKQFSELEKKSKNTEKYSLYKKLYSDKSAQLSSISEIYILFLANALDLNFKADITLHEALGMQLVKENLEDESKEILENDTLESVMKELSSLTGLENIKNEIQELTHLLEIQKSRQKKGLKNVDIALHTVFTGSPGTGKTTVARLLSRVYFHLGYISKGHLVETDREGLVAGYVGQTATKTNEIIEKSKGGVLFIDEAYSLSDGSGTQDYGAEAISTLLKRMEDFRSDLVVIVAGYPEPIQLFIQSNPGLRSRFTRYFDFKDFTTIELVQIFKNYCLSHDFKLNEDAEEKLSDMLSLLTDKKHNDFGNARDVRTLFEKCVQLQANRLVKLKSKKERKLEIITEEDIPSIKEVEKLLHLET